MTVTSDREAGAWPTERIRRLVWLGAGVLVAAALAYLSWQVVTALAAVLIPIATAVLLASLLEPVARRLIRIGCPRWLAAMLLLIGSLGFLGGLVTLTINALITGAGDLGGTLRNAIDTIRDWLVRGPLHLSQPQIDAATGDLVGLVTSQTERILGGATATAAAVGAFLAGLVLTVFVLYFLLYDGERIWRQLLRGCPARLRSTVDLSGRSAFRALGAYTRATLVVALVDAVAIGIGLAIIGVPMVIPLASLVFLGAFVPYVGAFISGFVAVLVALVSGGPVAALLVLALSVGVQELEGDVLQPFLLGKMVRLHPLVVILAIAIGVVLAGIVGALFAVPTVLVLRSFGGKVWRFEQPT